MYKRDGFLPYLERILIINKHHNRKNTKSFTNPLITHTTT